MLFFAQASRLRFRYRFGAQFRCASGTKPPDARMSGEALGKGDPGPVLGMFAGIRYTFTRDPRRFRPEIGILPPKSVASPSENRVSPPGFRASSPQIGVFPPGIRIKIGGGISARVPGFPTPNRSIPARNPGGFLTSVAGLKARYIFGIIIFGAYNLCRQNGWDSPDFAAHQNWVFW